MASTKPSAITEQEIKLVVDEYLLNALPLKQRAFNFAYQEENVKRCYFGQGKYLIISKYNLHELPLGILKRLPIYLVKQFAVQVEFDSVWYWALTHDVIKSAMYQCAFKNWQLIQDFETMMASHFANLCANNYDLPAIERLNRATMNMISPPIKDLVLNNATILMYICYPVLEGLTNFVLSPLIDNNGYPIAQFSANGKSFDKGDRKISNLGMLLHALEENGSKILSKPEFSENLRDFRLEIEKISPSSDKSIDGWDSIYALRNASLHGTTGGQLRSGLLTNLICLILWNSIDEQILNKELERLSKSQMPIFDDNYYPPEF